MSSELRGGLGGDETPPRVRDFRLQAKALRKGWALLPELQEEIAHSQAEIALNPKIKARYRTAAANALIQADLKQQAIDLAREKAEGQPADITLTEVVDEAERRAEERRSERNDP